MQTYVADFCNIIFKFFFLKELTLIEFSSQVRVLTGFDFSIKSWKKAREILYLKRSNIIVKLVLNLILCHSDWILNNSHHPTCLLRWDYNRVQIRFFELDSTILLFSIIQSEDPPSFMNFKIFTNQQRFCHLLQRITLAFFEPLINLRPHTWCPFENGKFLKISYIFSSMSYIRINFVNIIKYVVLITENWSNFRDSSHLNAL